MIFFTNHCRHDVDLPDDTGDEEYLEILAQWLPRLFDEYKPKLVMYQVSARSFIVC